MRFETLPQALAAAAATASGIRFLEAGGPGQRIGYAALQARALHVLQALQARGVGAGDEMVICAARPAALVDALWACLLGGIVAVPLAAGGTPEHRRKVVRVLASLQRPALFTDANSLAWLASGPGAPAALDGLRIVCTEALRAGSGAGRPHAGRAGDAAIVQFSSGSTGEPKGVVLSHRNVLGNIEGIRAAARASAADVFLNWMPLTHDMGLVGFHLGPLVLGAEQALLPTELFVRRPLRWLEAASALRATLLAAPSFGIRHTLRALGAGVPSGLDLAAVRLVFNGAEPVDARLCRDFTAALGPSGLAAAAMFPVYGLAEATLAVTLPEPGAPMAIVHAARGSLGCGSALRLLPAESAEAVALVCVGRPVAGCALRLADADGTAVPEGVVGQLSIRGPNVTSGYYGSGPATLAAEGWLDTGDLAVSLGALYIVGRVKDIVIVNGQNLHAHDLEALCEREAGVAAGHLAIAGTGSAGPHGEAVLVFVQHRSGLDAFSGVASRISAALGAGAGVEAAAIVPLRTLPRTTSGKLQRHALRAAYERGEHAGVLAASAALRAPAAPARVHSPTEELLRRICDGVVAGPGIGVDADLLELGCDSLALAEIHAAIEVHFPAVLRLEDFYDHPTIAALARRLDAAAAATALAEVEAEARAETCAGY